MVSPYVGELAAVATAVLWTCSTLAWTVAGRQIGSLAVCFVRLVLAVGMLELYSGLAHGIWFPDGISSGVWFKMGASGVMGFFLSDWCLFQAYLMIGPRLALLLLSLSPPLAALMSWDAVGDVLQRHHWLGMAITLAGVVWVVLERPDHAAAPSGRALQWGVALAFLAAVFQALGFTLAHQGMLIGCNPISATLIRVLAGLACYVPVVAFTGAWPRMFAVVRRPRLMGVLLAGTLVGPFLGVILCMVALGACQTGIVTTILSTMPVLILPAVILLDREPVSLRAAGGAGLSVLGVAILVAG